jgi:translation initiation factor RLI1
LDSERRIIAAKVIKSLFSILKKTAFIEHDFIMATYLADRVTGMMVYLRKGAGPGTIAEWDEQKFLKELRLREEIRQNYRIENQ